jgi:hypothetical protein
MTYRGNPTSMASQASIYSLKCDEVLADLAKRFFDRTWQQIKHRVLLTNKDNWGVASILITHEMVDKGLGVTNPDDFVRTLDTKEGLDRVKWTYDMIFDLQ